MKATITIRRTNFSPLKYSRMVLIKTGTSPKSESSGRRAS